MFFEPVRYTKLRNAFEVMKYSKLVFTQSNTSIKKVYCIYRDQIIFVDENGYGYMTPYREEIMDVLEKEDGYKSSSFILNMPESSRKEIDRQMQQEDYKWLMQMANSEEWNLTFEKAHTAAQNNNVKEVEIDESLIRFFQDVTTEEYILGAGKGSIAFKGMVEKHLNNGSELNVASFIRFNSTTLLICDNYGRTFLVRFTKSTNHVVNQLLEAGYTYTTYPWLYVVKKEKHT